MFKRLIVEEWHTIIAVLAFFLTAAAFVFFSVKALRMRKEKREHLANLPLQREDQMPDRDQH